MGWDERENQESLDHFYHCLSKTSKGGVVRNLKNKKQYMKKKYWHGEIKNQLQGKKCMENYIEWYWCIALVLFFFFLIWSLYFWGSLSFLSSAFFTPRRKSLMDMYVCMSLLELISIWKTVLYAEMWFYWIKDSKWTANRVLKC